MARCVFITQALILFRPLARLRFNTIRPFLVAIRARKPCTRLRFNVPGLYVLFIFSVLFYKKVMLIEVVIGVKWIGLGAVYVSLADARGSLQNKIRAAARQRATIFLLPSPCVSQNNF